MDTAHKTKEQKKEFFDDEKILEQKISKLAEMIKNAKHFIVFTGAGISTSTGIPDYRSGKDTVLQTGPGVWEKRALKLKNNKNNIKVPMQKAVPSKTHMALVELQRQGILKYLVSQNTDGLHRKSGFNPNKLCEIHGNTNLEICKKCGKKYLRDFRVRTSKKVHDHDTGRKCDNQNCKGKLKDSIINFGEDLPEKELDNGYKNAEKADLCLVLGSSLTVNPACEIPEIVGENEQLVIVNLQSTPLDDISLRINGLCDNIMEKLMEKLELQIPEFFLQKRIQIKKTLGQLQIQGLDMYNSPFSLFKQIKIIQGKNNVTSIKNSEPYSFTLLKELKQDSQISIEIEFMKHYGEPNYQFKFKLQELKDPLFYLLEYDVKTQAYKNVQQYKPENNINTDIQKQKLKK